MEIKSFMSFSFYKILILSLFILSFAQASGQKQGNVWYFGRHGGLDFNSGAPVVLEDGVIDNLEGVSTICDADGNLLFYTDGMVVYNRTHQVMQNGSGLAGHPSSTQSGVIVPVPGSSAQYLIFTVDYAYNAGDLCYSTVDMSLDGGLGAVVSKNNFLQSNSAEKISAVLHENRMDIWVVIHERWNSNYKSYLVTSSGVSGIVVTSNTGADIQDGVQGYLKFSSDGLKLAMATYHRRKVEVCSFNKSSGQITYNFGFNYPDATYGVEFSKNGKFLYATVSFDMKQIYQIDIDQQTNVLISTPGMAPGALQLGPDGKIYVARYNRPNTSSKYLGVINNPEAAGSACNYVDEAIHLGSGGSLMGLPTFIQSFFNVSVTLEANNSCKTDPVQFNAYLSDDMLANLDWMLWDFGDPGSSQNTSAVISPIHSYANAGTFNVTYSVSSAGVEVTRNIQVTIWDTPQINLPDTVGICPGFSGILNAGDNSYIYKWNTQQTSNVLEVSIPGEYSVKKTDGFGCFTFDTTWVKMYSLPELNLPDTVGICPGFSEILNAGDNSYIYKWNTLQTSNVLEVSIPGEYSVKKTNGFGCFSFDTTWVKYYSLPELSLGNDMMLCDQEKIILQADGYESYLWQDGSQDNEFQVTSTGIYTLTATTTDHCSITDEIQIFDCCEFSLILPNVFTPNNDGLNDVFNPLISEVSQYIMTIANRWGAVLFTSYDRNIGWDGRFENSKCPEGVYFVILEYTRCGLPGQEFTDRTYGSVTLLRK